MAIDRSQVHHCLRQRTLLTSAGISGALFALLPAAALICLLAGYVVAGVCWLVIGVFTIVAVVGVVLGCLALLFGGGGEISGGGFAGLCVGGICWAALSEWQSSLETTADHTIAACIGSATFVVQNVFVGMGVYAWSWLPLFGSLLAAGAVLATVGLLRFETPVKRSLFRIAYTCPRCSHRGLPHVRCPTCDALITDLTPSAHGVWTARCGGCRAELATTDLAGRLKYPKVCANCSSDLDNKSLGRSREYTIAIVGAQSSGKSTFMISALHHLESICAPQESLTIEFTNEDEERQYREGSRRLMNRKFPAKTISGGIPSAFNVTLKSADGRDRLLYLYDAAGEDFEDQDRLEDHSFHRFIDGIVFIVDPFAEPRFAASLSDDQRKKIQPATTDASEILDQLITFLEKRRHIAAGERFDCPIAVVMTKTDMMKVRPKSSQSVAAREILDGMTSVEARRAYVRKLLCRCGSRTFLRTVESRFQTITYCDWSSLQLASAGSTTKTNPFSWFTTRCWPGSRSWSYSEAASGPGEQLATKQQPRGIGRLPLVRGSD